MTIKTHLEDDIQFVDDDCEFNLTVAHTRMLAGFSFLKEAHAGIRYNKNQIVQKGTLYYAVQAQTGNYVLCVELQPRDDSYVYGAVEVFPAHMLAPAALPPNKTVRKQLAASALLREGRGECDPDTSELSEAAEIMRRHELDKNGNRKYTTATKGHPQVDAVVEAAARRKQDPKTAEKVEAWARACLNGTKSDQQ